MSELVHSRLINDPFLDPGLFIDFRFGRRAMLFDLGDIVALAARELLRVSHVFVSHRHLDHFSGFDRLLRIKLSRAGMLTLIGPSGLAAGVHHKLQSYSWNLLDEEATDFAITVQEFQDCRLTTSTVFSARRAFRPVEQAPPTLPPNRVLTEADFHIDAATLDHGLPCLGFVLQERLRVNVRSDGLSALNLAPGAWLNDAKTAVRQGSPDDLRIPVSDGRTLPLGFLKAEAFRIGRGQRIAYVTDASYTPANVERILCLAAEANHLYIEAHFLEEDAQLAAERKHLTARQAGSLARQAGVRRLTVFHHSPRYSERPDALRLEAESAFKGEI